ncbi:MAG: hypothetical protein HY816_04340 [Candidatus Wallbacteria bacterium]|nr:hypothetical protein [Candidatus Wallbacteria bacterium]
MNSSHAPGASPERVRLAWGRRGIAGAVERGDAVIIVDVLSLVTVHGIVSDYGRNWHNLSRSS